MSFGLPRHFDRSSHDFAASFPGTTTFKNHGWTAVLGILRVPTWEELAEPRRLRRVSADFSALLVKAWLKLQDVGSAKEVFDFFKKHLVGGFNDGSC